MNVETPPFRKHNICPTSELERALEEPLILLQCCSGARSADLPLVQARPLVEVRPRSCGASPRRVVHPRSIHSPQALGSTSPLQVSLFVKVGGGGFRLQRGPFERSKTQRIGYENQSHPGLYRGAGAQDRHSNNRPAPNFCRLCASKPCAARLPTPHLARHRARGLPSSRLGIPGSPCDRSASLTLSSSMPARIPVSSLVHRPDYLRFPFSQNPCSRIFIVVHVFHKSLSLTSLCGVATQLSRGMAAAGSLALGGQQLGSRRLLVDFLASEACSLASCEVSFAHYKSLVRRLQWLEPQEAWITGEADGVQMLALPLARDDESQLWCVSWRPNGSDSKCEVQ